MGKFPEFLTLLVVRVLLGADETDWDWDWDEIISIVRGDLAICHTLTSVSVGQAYGGSRLDVLR